MVKCCWSECKKKATNSLGTLSSKGSLDMCSDCMKSYSEHTDAREKAFRKDIIKAVRKNLNEVEKKIDNPYSYYTGDKNNG